MSAISTCTDDLSGTWNAAVTFVKGPREGEREPVVLTFLPDGVIVHADEIRRDTGQLPRGIGEWTAQDDRLSYWFHVALTDPEGRPTSVVHIRASGTVGPDGQTFAVTGTGEVYGPGSEPLVTHHVNAHATRAER